MDAHWEFRRRAEARLDAERGRGFNPGGHRFALVVPSPYPQGMSGLGALWVYDRVNAIPGWGSERLFAPDPPWLDRPWRAWPHAATVTLETRTPLSEFALIGVSLSAEVEVIALLKLLRAAGVEPLRGRRSAGNGAGPVIVAGGPLALVAPGVVGAIADLVFLGDADESLPLYLGRVGDGAGFFEAAAGLDGVWDPALPALPPPERVLPSGTFPPAVSRLTTPEGEFGEKILVEVGRGCSRACAFCMMSRRARPCGMRLFSQDAILAALRGGESDFPASVGLVGAAVSDHPHLVEIVETLAATGTKVSLSSVRADRASRELLTALAAGGLRTLTLGLDGASERLRAAIEKQCTESDFLSACEHAAAAGLHAVKVYCILGYPDETDDDLAELADLLLRVPRSLQVRLSLSALTPKPGTPMEDAPLPHEKTLLARVRLLKKRLGHVKIQAPSVKDAAFEHAVDHADGAWVAELLNQLDQS